MKKDRHGDASNGKKFYLYVAWVGIKQRCYNINNRGYKNYGKRGIKMYTEWINNYKAFKAYIQSNLGERPEGYSLDRINNDGNYEPNNLRWASSNIQNYNKRSNINLNENEINKIIKLIKENNFTLTFIATKFNVSYSTIHRIKNKNLKNLHLRTKITLNDKLKIYSMLDNKITMREIAKIFNITQSNVSKLKRNRYL